jgi:parallel beta-helix repeat protein
MQALRKTASVLLFPTLVCLGVACERTGIPTDPTSAAAPVFNEHGGDGTTRWVNYRDPNDGPPPGYAPPGTSCDDPGYKTVQDGVNAAAAGDRINVCPGTYMEQVTIGTSDLLLRSTKRWQAVIKAPPTMAVSDGEAIVRVEFPARNVTILAFTITGPGNGYCGSIGYGIRVNDASANILGNHITDIRDQYDPITGQPSGCQNGWGVVVGQRYADPEPTTIGGSAKIEGNVIERYQKNGVVVGGSGSNAEITANRVLGIGHTTKIAQNGIEALYATAEIKHNFVAQNNYTPGTPTTDESTGILLFQSGKVATEHNTVTANGVGIYVFDAGTGSTTTKNHIRAGNNDGVAIDCFSNCSVGSQVADNKIEHNAGPGIGVYNGAQHNGLDDNHVEDNGDSGILLDYASNNTVSNNKVRDNGTDNKDMTDGIRVNSRVVPVPQPSTGNIISENRLKHNVTHDCHDFSSGTGTAGTANTWTDNRGETSVPTALCGDDDDDADFATTTTYGWDASYPWYSSYDSAADPELDWATAYAGIDTESLLQLLPQIQLGSVVKRTVSP